MFTEYQYWTVDEEHKRKDRKGKKMKKEDIDKETFVRGQWGGEPIDKDHWALKDAKSYYRFLTSERGYSRFSTTKA